jgi:DtxR family Mn-dependent transcriptional regulator
MAKSSNAELSDAVGDYLKALWALAHASRQGTDLTDLPAVSTNDLAIHLGITAPSVTGMLNKLAKRGLVDYQRYHGATLTPVGKQEALRLIRRHRLIETFLHDYLDYSWDEIHEEAEVMEHTMSDRFTERLAAKLGHPIFDPHGDPIPSAEGTLPKRVSALLVDLKVNESLKVTRILSQDSHVLHYLLDAGIQPQTRVRVVAIEPFGNLLQLHVTPVDTPTNTPVDTPVDTPTNTPTNTATSRPLAMSAALAQLIEGTPLTPLPNHLS